MIDRGIGLAGIGLALIFGATEYFQAPLPGWMPPIGAGLGMLLLGISAGLLWSGNRRNSGKPSPVERAMLRLHIYANNHLPDRLADENIFRWYYLSHISLCKNKMGCEWKSHFPRCS